MILLNCDFSVSTALKYYLFRYFCHSWKSFVVNFTEKANHNERRDNMQWVSIMHGMYVQWLQHTGVPFHAQLGMPCVFIFFKTKTIQCPKVKSRFQQNQKKKKQTKKINKRLPLCISICVGKPPPPFHQNKFSVAATNMFATHVLAVFFYQFLVISSCCL